MTPVQQIVDSLSLSRVNTLLSIIHDPNFLKDLETECTAKKASLEAAVRAERNLNPPKI